ncbi:LysR family transcriptional regulator [Jannaschia sp. W003]|uniref:LysR family transcriptional regulator n=1 Tax=Jannaschia sp. W003 TaxID=2867012 RepID=UPI0021A8BE8E|nr:LysR family transcriptional regulator [Jannaschia sp. W003]UWQ20160.1 LysR family transcriptional regulator [Jannaschia sp. W003]
MALLENIRLFVRVYELGSMSAAARDQRVSPAVASSRIAALEQHLAVRLFQRTTRSLRPTEHGEAFYAGAREVIEALEAAEGRVAAITGSVRGLLGVAAPLALGRRILAPRIPEFADAHPEVRLRLRLTDRNVDLTGEGLDLAVFLGTPEDSTLKLRKICDCRRVLVASPGYVAARGMPKTGADLLAGHECLILRFPGAAEFRWPLDTPEGTRRFAVTGRLDSDDGAVLTNWALAGRGIALKPLFEVAAHLASGALVEVCEAARPAPVQLVCLTTHRRLQDPKRKLFMDWAVPVLRDAVAAAEAHGPAVQEPR